VGMSEGEKDKWRPRTGEMAQIGCAHRNVRPMPRLSRRFICFGEGPGLDDPSTKS
jgi:hypothetical protein